MAGFIILGVLAYIFLCVLVAWIGRNARLGFWGVFIIASLATPFITFLFVILLGPKNVSAKQASKLSNSTKS